MQFVKPAPFREAVEKLGRRSIVTSTLDSQAWSRVPLAIRERSFFIAQVESARLMQRGRDAIANFLREARETLPNGQTVLKTGSRADFIKQLQDFAIAEGLGPLDPKDAGTIKDIRSERRLGLIFDTQTRQASDFGYYQQGLDPAVLHEFPAQRFIRVSPAKEPRDEHARHEGVVRLKSDVAFWTGLNQDFGVPWGPWGWGCGHDVEDVDRAEAIRLGLLPPDPPAAEEDPRAGERQAAEAARVQHDFNRRLELSLQKLDLDLRQQLERSFSSPAAEDAVNLSPLVQFLGDDLVRLAAPEPRPEPPSPPSLGAQPTPLQQLVQRLSSLPVGATVTLDGRPHQILALDPERLTAQLRDPQDGTVIWTPIAHLSL